MKNYFEKFSIMFVMSLILMLGTCTSAFADGGGVVGINNLNNTTENSAKIGNELKLPEVGWKRYDDSNSYIKCSSSKVSNNNSSWFVSYKDYSYNKTATSTVYGTNTKDESISFGFYGSKLRIIAPVWGSATPSVDVYIDNVLVGNFSEQLSANYQQFVYQISGLNKSNHSVKIVNKDSSGNYFNFDALDIDQDGYLLPYDESISLDKSTMNLNAGDSQQLIATTTPAGAQLTWSSENTGVATVDSTGKVTGVSAGTCIITAKAVDGLTATCTVTVTNSGSVTPTNPIDGTSNIVNIARAKGDNTNNASGEVTIIFHGTADTTLSVVKTADVKEVWVGDNFTYTIVVTNTSSKTAKAVIINDSAPNHIQFKIDGITTTQGKVDTSSTSSNVIVNVGDIPPLGTVTIKIPVTVV
jgi:uncharacterized repeat protein (TIGR01451 family)